MSATLVVFRRELASYFATPVAYVFIFMFLLLSGFHVYSRVQARSEASEHWARLPFYALYFLLVALQAVETLAPLAGT